TQAASTTKANDVPVPFNANAAQNATLSATLTGPINGGSVTFTVVGIAKATCTDSSVTGGTASCKVPIPANQAAQGDTITATYSATMDVKGSSGNATLTIK